MWIIVNALQKGLIDAGFDLGKTESPVTPVFLNGNPIEAANLMMDLRENHAVFCSGVLYPVVPKGVVLLRLIPTAIHTLEDVDYTIKAFSSCYQKLKDGVYDNGQMGRL